ncbi:MAG: hypothetical protein ACYCVE_05060, partial [Gemmatimonadaceae bacterium]
IRNMGFDGNVSVQLARTRWLTWQESVGFSQNTNALVSMARADTNQGWSGLHLHVGYPVGGIWSYPLIGYSDKNHDGVIEPNEVLLGDTLAYMGYPEPAYTGTVTTTVGLPQLGLIADATLTHEGPFTQTLNSADNGISRAFNDPSSPLAAQALAESYLTFLPSLGPGTGKYGDFQQVTDWRLGSVSVSWRVPRVAARLFAGRALTIRLQGTNLWLRTNFRGKDPDVIGASGLERGFAIAANGVIPQPRTWLLDISVAY